MTSSALEQAIRACEFWAGMEYMNLPKVPDPDERQSIFHIDNDADLPWRHKRRMGALRHWRDDKVKAQVAYCGLMTKRDCTSAIRTMLQEPALGAEDMRSHEATAVVLIPLDDTGRVCGEVFVSSFPWLMGRLSAHVGAGKARGNVDLTGFDEYQDDLMRGVRRLLEKLQLVRKEEAHDTPKASAASRDGQSGDAAKQAGQGAEGSASQGQEPARPAPPLTRDRPGVIGGPADMLPLELSHVQQVLDLVWNSAGWRPDCGPYTQAGSADSSHLLRIKVMTISRDDERSVDLGAMNSLIANDVIRVRAKLVAGESVGPALQQYLKLVEPPSRLDLRDGSERGGLDHFVAMLSPTKLPYGAWPDFPLVSAQQFAVNMAREHLSGGGLYGVNGPPGTGKSTLLRDVIASCVVDRAHVMASFSKPSDALVGKADIEGYQYGYWKLHERLLGHGIVVASSNNGAVENVIKDLPRSSSAMMKSGATYFRAVAESVATGPKRKGDEPVRDVASAWGLVAALMGSSKKKSAFLSRFWFDTKVEPKTTPNPARLRSIGGVINDGTHGAKPWKVAVQDFNKSIDAASQRASDLKESIELYKLVELQRKELVSIHEHLPALYACHQVESDARNALEAAVEAAEARSKACKALRTAQAAHAEAEAAYQSAVDAARALTNPQQAADALETARKDASTAETDAKDVLDAKPDFFERLTNWGAMRGWRARVEGATQARAAARQALKDAEALSKKVSAADSLVTTRRQELDDRAAELNALEGSAAHHQFPAPVTDAVQQSLDAALLQARQRHQAAVEVARARAREISGFEDRASDLEAELQRHSARLSALKQLLASLDESFYDRCDLLKMRDEELQLLVPYRDNELRDLRVRVFCDAMHVNQSFVVEAWPKLRSTVSAFVNYQNGQITQAQVGQAAVHLWNAFFTVVPVVSSTFASFGRLFAGLGREEIGMLLIDEAGQSTPQNALGAIWRSRQVISVGDPLQLVPVVPQPVEALSAWRQWTGASQLWEPPACSTQVLADDMTPYGTTLNLGNGGDTRTVWVGSPLRVHRRCLSPMFDVANNIAYANLMVHGVDDKTSHDDWIGRSHWFDVRGAGQGHWVQAQGDAALELVRKLRNSKTLRGELKNKEGGWHINVITPYKDVGREFGEMLRAEFKDVPDITGMSGTVHTFQGKEADVVILLLGGNPDKEGAVSFFAGNEEAPNLLNVALTRAKKRIYVVGDKKMWTGNSGTFEELALQLDRHFKMANAPAAASPLDARTAGS